MYGNITSIESILSRRFVGSKCLRHVTIRASGVNRRGYLAINHLPIFHNKNNEIKMMMMKHRIPASQSDEVGHTMYQLCCTSKMTKEK